MRLRIYVKEVLVSRGISQKSLAEMTGLRPMAVSNLCRGTLDRIQIDHIERIAVALDIVDISELLRFSDV